MVAATEVAAAVPAAGVVTTVAAGNVSLPDKTSLVLVEMDPFAVDATGSAVEVMVTGNSDIWSQATVEVLVPGVLAPFPVTVPVQV